MSPRLLAVIETTWKGLSGLSGSILAVILPWQENLEWGVRVAGALIGLLVGVLSVISLWKGLKK